MSEEKADYIFTEASVDGTETKPRGVLPYPLLAELPDLEADQYLVLRCARAMTAKLAESCTKGRSGWHTPRCNDEDLRKLLREHVEKGDMVDVLNLAGMILVRQEAASATEPTLVLGPTGGAGTRTEKIQNMLETYNGTSQTAPYEGESGGSKLESGGDPAGQGRPNEVNPNRSNLTLFRRGVCVFWTEQAKEILKDSARAVFLLFMLTMAALAVTCACEGFYLTRAPVSTPWTLVWMGRLSAVFWVGLGLYLFVTGIIKMGREAAEDPGHSSGCR